MVTIRHWLPIMTFCPVNHLPDLVYCSVTFNDNEVHELYEVRRRIRRLISGRKEFMETLADDLAKAFPHALCVSVRLMFNRHEIVVTNVKHQPEGA
jgi:hypothetical protein